MLNNYEQFKNDIMLLGKDEALEKNCENTVRQTEYFSNSEIKRFTEFS